MIEVLNIILILLLFVGMGITINALVLLIGYFIIKAYYEEDVK